jgi:hypothetical protein
MAHITIQVRERYKKKTHRVSLSCFGMGIRTRPAGRKVCVKRWVSAGLNKHIAEILAGLERWKASDRWKRGYVADPLTFLNQERWKDIPPVPVQQPAKGEVRVRETTAQEKAAALWDTEVMRQRRLSENWRKSDDEIAQLARDAPYDSSVTPEIV